MAIPLVPVVVGGAVVAYAAVHAAPTVAPVTNPTPAPPPGATKLQVVQGLVVSPAPKKKLLRDMQPVANLVGLDPALRVTDQPSGNNIDPDLQKWLDKAQADCESKWETLNDSAKAQAADYMNGQLSISPPLTGRESWAEIANRTGDAAGEKFGSQAGAGVGNYLGGPIGSKVGAMCGAYLGKKLADVIEDYGADAAKWVGNKVEDAADSVADAAADAYNWFTNKF